MPKSPLGNDIAAVEGLITKVVAMLVSVIATVAMGAAATIAPMTITSIIAIPVVNAKCLVHPDCTRLGPEE